MGKISKEEQARRDGFDYFVRLYRSQEVRIPELDEEIERRNLTGKPIGMDKKTEKEFTLKVQEYVQQAMITLFIWVLHNKMEFGEKRILRVLDWIWDMTDLVNGDWVELKDLTETLSKETGVELHFDWID